MIKKRLTGTIFFSVLKLSPTHTGVDKNNCGGSIAPAELNFNIDKKIRPCFKDGNA